MPALGSDVEAPPLPAATDDAVVSRSEAVDPDWSPAVPVATWRTPHGAHPVVFVDPRPWTLLAARSLAPAGTRLVMLSSRRLEPALHARGVERHHLPPLATHPERWQARLLELAAQLEPRPAVFACSAAALELLRRSRRALEPHLTLANSITFETPGPSMAPDAVLRQTLLRGEAALEVQIVVDTSGTSLGQCVLAWAPGAPPDVLVTSVAGTEVAHQSQQWLQARKHTGYARMVWAPDRFGRLTLQAATPLLGAAVALAAADGIDFPALCYAAATGARVVPRRARGTLTRRIALLDPDTASLDAPLVEVPVRLTWKDPLPWAASLLRALVRP
jgi:hypothetical protein